MNADLFGTGEAGGNRNFTAPVYGCDESGNPVTVSFGIGKKEGQTLIADGHLEMEQFYGPRNQKGHDYFGPGIRPSADRGKYSGDSSKK